MIEVSPTTITLDDGSVIPCGMVVWSTGVAPRYSQVTINYGSFLFGN